MGVFISVVEYFRVESLGFVKAKATRSDFGKFSRLSNNTMMLRDCRWFKEKVAHEKESREIKAVRSMYKR